MLRTITERLAAGRKLFLICTPDPTKCVKTASRLGKILKTMDRINSAKKIVDIDSIEQAAKEVTCSAVGGQIYRRINMAVTSSLEHSAEYTAQPLLNKKNGIGGRSWIRRPYDDERMIKRIRIIYHDADKAGKHLDIHIGHLSLVINIAGKPIADKIAFNSNGELTVQSKSDLIDLLRDEINNKSRMIQNLDHSMNNAEATWLATGKQTTGYGAGKTRQVVMSSDAEILSVSDGNSQSIKMYAPEIDSHNMLYVHKLYYGDNGKPPVVIFGSSTKAPKFEGRLKLKKTKTIDDFKERIDVRTTTVKHDGASANVETDHKKTLLFSPRTDQDGNNIPYHTKLPELYRITCDGKSVFMGELLLKEKFNPLVLKHWMNDRYLTAAQIGGILNAHNIRPKNIVPEFRIYRMDKWNGQDVILLPFFKNRALQKKFGKLSRYVKPVKLTSAKMRKGIEGLVAVPIDGNVMGGYAIRFWGDLDDWEVKAVELKFGPTGRTAGVIHFKSLESGKSYKLGPGQLGSESDCLMMMKAGNKLVGQVAKVKSRQGHEGRSAKLLEWHLDKGIGH